MGVASLGALMVAHGNLDPDESQHLHIAWLIGQGRVPYADFWEHHMPLLPLALAPVTRWLADEPGVYFVARAIMAVTGAATLWILYGLGNRVGPGVGLAAVALLAVQVRFLQHVIQVRPDAPALLAWLVTVLMLVRWRERDREAWLWVAGFALGITATLTPKAAFLGVGAVAVILASPSRSFPRAFGRLARVAAGCAVPLVVFFVWLAVAGGQPALSAFVADVVLANLRFPDSIKQTAVGVEGAGFIVLGLIGVAMAVRRLGIRALRHPVHGPLLLPAAIVTLILLLPTTPAVYSYTWLPIITVGAIYAGLALVVAIERARDGALRERALLALVIVGGLAVPLVVFCALTLPPNRRNDVELSRMRRELAYACPGEAVLDGRALAVFRPTALRYPSLVRGLRTWIKQGVIPPSALVEDLRRARAPVGVLDSRLRDDEAIASFIARHYVREPDDLLLAGAAVDASAGAGDASIDVLVPGRYEMTPPPRSLVMIDGQTPQAGGTWLREGQHRLSWSEERGTIRLTIVPCARREP